MENEVKKGERPQNKNLIPLKKGNNMGSHRPLGQRNYATLRAEAIVLLAKKNGKTPAEIEVLLHANALGQALKGNYSFYKDDTDRIHGKPDDHVDITSAGEQIGSLSAEAIAEAERILKLKKTNG